MTARFMASIAVLIIFIASQLFWYRQGRNLAAKLIPSKTWRRVLGAVVALAFLLMLAYNLPWMGRRPSATSLTLGAALLEAPFGVWVGTSLLGFVIACCLWTLHRAVRALAWVYRRLLPRPQQENNTLQSPASPSRRKFLEQTALAACATPFVAGTYGLLYGRLNLQTSLQRIHIPRLPKAFDGFRIAQLSDIHIGPFMPAEEIRKFVAIANELKPDLVALTGDYVTWDPSTQEAVAEALSGLRASFGVFGCLGNHEMYTQTQQSLPRLFSLAGIRILRQERVLIQSGGENLNVIGVDFQTVRQIGPRGEGLVRRYLRGVDHLVAPDTANILLSHNPNSFDRAAELGIDLSLAGHTHGGQVTLEFVHPKLSPSRLITPYVRGWFQKPGGQLYVNRGIGTIGVPVRFGAPPEITLFELVRNA